MAEQQTFQFESGGSIPTSPLQLGFKKIQSITANEIFVKYHYAHRAVPISWCFGAYFNGDLMGAISFGKPASPSLCKGICGEENSSRVYELNRLWMDDKCPKNSESRFIGWALRKLKSVKPALILVSYADTDQNHLGIIYRATNWIYTGKTVERTDIYTPNGKHSRHYEKGSDYSKNRKRRSAKHRYVCFINPEDKKYLKWKVVPWRRR